MPKHPTKLLVLRFSSLGDVAMVAPVLNDLLNEYPDVEVTMVSRQFHAPFFQYNERIKFHGINLDDYKGVFGMLKLARELSKLDQFDAIIDLHEVLRTKLIKLFYPRKHIKKVATIGKGRAAKQKLTRKKNKELKPLKFMTQRYADVFEDVGLPFQLRNTLIRNEQPLTNAIIARLGQKKSNWIGIAPFAKHKTKRLPFSKAEEVIKGLSKLPNVKILLFGGGKKEEMKLDDIETQYENCFNVTGKLSLSDQLNLISHLDVMVSMDSANMHFASMMGTPVVSIWGGTHPFLGFLGYGQSITDVVQTELACRPCSVFGDTPCYRGDYACLHRISEEDILINVSKFLTQTN